MKIHPLFFLLPPVVFTSCWPTPGRVELPQLPSQGFTAYSPPQGNPGSENSWNLRGPGTVLRVNRYEVEYGARSVVGQQQLAQMVIDANNPQTRVPFAALSNKRTSGGSVDASGGWNIAEVVNIKAALNISNSTTYDIQFGNTWVAELTEQDLHKATGIRDIRKPTILNLRQGKSHLVLKTVYTDSLKIYFKTEKQGGGKVAVDIPLQNQDKLEGKYKVTNDGGVEISGPIMVGYVQVGKEGIESIFPKK